VYEGTADPYDPGMALGLAGMAMTGGIGGAPAGAIGSGPIRAYHGSPHDFDKFSLDKIGTGEGAQAYGHGLYFAEHEGVARSYRDALSNSQTVSTTTPRGQALYAVQNFGDDAEKWLTKQLASHKDGPLRERYAEALEMVRSGATKPEGRMYEVQINADPDRFLDWDKPLRAQPEPAKEALAKTFGDMTTLLPERVIQGKNGRWYTVGPDDRPMGRLDGWPEQSAANEALKVTRQTAIPEKTFGEWFRTMNSPVANAEKLKEAGIPGIKYLDAGSRGGDGTAGSRNYVVFDDSIVEIVKKYGIAGLALLPPAVLMANGIDPASVGQEQ
jgi:hypothetical protein